MKFRIQRLFQIGVISAALGILPLVLHNQYYLSVIFLTLLYTTLAMTWNILGGYLNQLNLGVNASVGIGMYVTTILWTMGYSPLFAMACGGLGAALLALIVSPIFKRLGGIYFAMSTLVLGLAIQQLFLNWTPLRALTGGASGIYIPNPTYSVFGVYEEILVLTVIVYVLVYFLESSRFRLIAGAIRADEKTAESIGIHAYRYKVIALVLTSFIFGIAGGIYAQYSSYMDPYVAFDLSNWSIAPVIMATLGGLGTLGGPMAGAIVLSVINQFFALSGEYRLLTYGVAIILVIIFLPNGFIGVIRKYWSKPASIDKDLKQLPNTKIEKQPAST
ncbi:MAG: branched-chain amino acid ABC transporter permease [Nitrososphaerota archaeon]|nr:branched-chain amino acid ABC transporter permease [Nitrososphaerota archaeon]